MLFPRRRLLPILVAMAAGGAALAQHTPAAKHDFPDPSLTGPPISWFTNLSADEMSWTVDSSGIGRADFVLERETMKLSWTVTYEKLTSPAVRVAIHGPQTPGGEAGVLIDLGEGGVASPIKGSTVINDGMLRYLVTDRFYLMITTAKNKSGEIRGQLQRVRPAATQ
jgi:hypothetical protein